MTLIEVYFEKMLRLGMRQLELQHYSSRKSDMEDELQMTALIIEQFDMDLLSGVWFHGQNVTHDPNSIGQLAANLLPPSNILLKKHSGKEVNLEIIEQMKQKMRLISEQLSSLQDKIKYVLKCFSYVYNYPFYPETLRLNNNKTEQVSTDFVS